MIYSSASRILCLQNEINGTRCPHTSRVFIEISTSNIDLINYSFQLENITQFLLETGVSRQFFVSPSISICYKFTFPPDIENVFIEVRSNDQLCTIVYVQSFNCPVYDVSEIGVQQGHYQTMPSIASFNVYFFLVKPTDAEYLNDQEQIIIQLTGIVNVQRRKNATVIFYLPENYNFLYITIFATIGLFLLIYFVAFRIMCKHPDIYDHLALEHLLLLEARTEREIAERGNNEQRYQTSEREENVKSTSGNEYERSRSTIEVIETLNAGFVTVNDLSVKDYDYLKQKFRIYPQTMLTIAIFYSLPVIQLVFPISMKY
ncbi:unnamed protein product [Rotaria sp. Silwood2]|nr:unnamed protein product [Rotaria sp. Silwood2]CAF4151504.1 unnamed protein product [Rotaria sp. Silwood2]